jgi:sn-glycerol 3-phosphate transport system ATP-binding protein
MDTAMVEQLGSNTLVHGFLSGTHTPLVASLQGVHSEASIGPLLRFDVPVSAQHVFDTETGRRV